MGQKMLQYFRKSSTFCPTTQEPQKVEVYRHVFSLGWVVSECTLNDAQTNVLCQQQHWPEDAALFQKK